jgi:uncharacterized protein (DUF1800 family)
MAQTAAERTQRAEVGHLLRRAGFPPTGAELDEAAQAGYEATVERLVEPRGPDPGVAATPPPDLPKLPPQRRDMPIEERRALMRRRRELRRDIALWWIDRMVAVRQPLVERVTFGWHDHWATSGQKVQLPEFMLGQYATLRRHALSDFRALAQAMVRDPALLVWLDGPKNRRGSPNENLARELMELFALGVGNYREQDVKEAARALTGWRVNWTTATSRFMAGRHDPGAKSVLDVTAPLDAASLVDVILARPESARFVVGRLWERHGGLQPPDAGTLDRLVAAYGPGRDVGATLRAMFLDPAFRGPAARFALVKSPVEWLVGARRALGASVPADALLRQLRGMGQVPFAPPSVGGWPAGTGWLTTAAASARVRLAQRLAAEADLAVVSDAAPRARPDVVARLLGVDAWTARTRAALDGAAADPTALVTLALAAPEYVVA